MTRRTLISNRLRSEFLDPDRGDEYVALLESGLAGGYEMRSLESIWADPDRTGPSIALRHDVDRPAARPAREMFLREKSVGVTSTFYFRLNSFPPNEALIGELLGAGFGVGYHFEEPADVAKDLALTAGPDIAEHGEEIVDRFRANVEMIRRRYQPELRSVSSHGEWISVRLGFANNEFVSDALLAECGLWFEAYDPLFTQQSSYVSDVALYPERWTSGFTLADAMAAGHMRICVLTHPERWFRSPLVNAVHLGRRALDEARYRLRRRSSN